LLLRSPRMHRPPAIGWSFLLALAGIACILTHLVAPLSVRVSECIRPNLTIIRVIPRWKVSPPAALGRVLRTTALHCASKRNVCETAARLRAGGAGNGRYLYLREATLGLVPGIENTGRQPKLAVRRVAGTPIVARRRALRAGNGGRTRAWRPARASPVNRGIAACCHAVRVQLMCAAGSAVLVDGRR
jgi:hypothetical protein